MKVIVHATSFLDELPSGAADSDLPLALLAGIGDATVEYRCGRDPQRPVRPDELAGAVAVIADLERYDAALLRRVGERYGGTLRFIARYGVGYDAIDIEAATECGVWVANAPGAAAEPTAEWTVATILDVAGRRIQQHQRAANGLPKQGAARLDVRGKRLGIVGSGAIGRTVADLMRGFEPQIVAYDPYPDERWAQRVNAHYLSLETLCAQADIITLHAAAHGQLIGAPQIAAMKPTTILINCARGWLVDNRAAHHAVANAQIWGYGIDEIWPEPDLPLHGLNIVTSPHVGSDSERGKLRMRQTTARQVHDCLSGKRPQHLLNPTARRTGK